MQDSKFVKKNVSRFDDDVKNSGSYLYTSEKLSSLYANARISRAIQENYSFSGKRVLDIGCGDGTYTLELALLGVKEIIGIDPAEAAVMAANKKAKSIGMDRVVKFKVGNIYNLKDEEHFDCIVLRGVLHHLPEPEDALHRITSLTDTLIILEPNGYNPVLKLLEKFSQYHIEHEERSFFPTTLEVWCEKSGLRVQNVQMINLVPMFCPDWMAIICRKIEPYVERIPILRQIGCGQSIIVANH